MKTFTEPVTCVRTYESGAIKTLKEPVRIKETALNDDTSDVRIAAGPYRIVMHCRNVGGTRTDNRTIAS